MADRGSGEVRYVGSDAARVSQGRTGAAAADVMSEGSQGTGQAVTQLREISGESKPTLEGRDRLLEATAKATNVLLTLENLEEAVNTALKIVTAGSGCDRISVLENGFDVPARFPSYYTIIYEFAKPGIISQMSYLEAGRISNTERDAFMERNYIQGDGFGGLLEEWDEPIQDVFVSLQVKACYAVPIRVNGHWWGVLCVDYCQEPTRIGSAEMAVLRTIADCIGSAIQRERSQQERVQAAQQRSRELEAYNRMLEGRDQLLETTARAANILLTLENFDEAISTALGIIGEGTGCDRISVLENSFGTSSPLPTRYSFIYDWALPEFLIPKPDSEIPCLPADQIDPVFLERYFLHGEGFGGLLEEWEEPTLRGSFEAAQVQSAYSVPIRVNGHWWGVLCFDYCRAPIRISSAEISVVRTIADCIGNAIQRERNQQERAQVVQQRADDLEEYNRTLLRRDQLLEATARATNVLLTLDNIDVAMESALTVLLEGTGCDRIEILENVYESSSPMPIRYLNMIQKCLEPKFETSPTDIESAQAAELSDAFKKYFLEMDGFGGSLEEWDEPLRSWLATLKIQSTYAVPIRVNGHWWGVLCFDYCRAPIQFNPAEVAVLRTIADCIGSAIERDRTQKALLEAEQNRVAELARANTAMRHGIDWLAHEPDMNAFLGHLLEELATQVNAQDAMIFLYDAQEHTLQPLVGVIDDEITFSPPFSKTFSADEWLGWSMLLRSPKPLSIALDTEPHLCLSEYQEYHRRRNNQGIVCTLLQQADEPLGFIGFGCPRKTFSENELQLVQSLAQQATLAIQLTRLAEEAQQAALLQERTRLAREIHDTLAQAFGGISMQLQAATYFAATKPEKAQTHLLAAQALAKDGLAEARRSVWTLYLETTEYENPDRAIAKFVEQTALGQSTPIQLTIDGTPYRLHPDVGLNLLRIAQESITNALRHAQAHTIQIHLIYTPETLQLRVRDDGCGFQPQSSSGGFGLLGMQQRAARVGATWHLVSQVGQGTTITVTVTNPVILSTTQIKSG